MIQSYPRAHCIDSMSRLIVLSGRRSILRLLLCLLWYIVGTDGELIRTY